MCHVHRAYARFYCTQSVCRLWASPSGRVGDLCANLMLACADSITMADGTELPLMQTLLSELDSASGLRITSQCMKTDELSEHFDADSVELWYGDVERDDVTELRELLSAFDCEDNGPHGFISEEDLRQACTQMAEGLSTQEVEEMVQVGLQNARTDDGWVNYDKAAAAILSE